MQENLTDVSERLEEKTTGTEETNLFSSPSCGAKKLCSDEGSATRGDSCIDVKGSEVE